MPTINARIRRHLAERKSHHHRIASGFLWVSFFVLVGKFAGAAKEMAIAWRYGVSDTVDAYVFVFNIVTWPVGIWFSVLTVVLIPLVAKTRNENPSALPQFGNQLLGLTVSSGLALGAGVYWGLPVLLNSGWTGLSGGGLATALAMAGPLSLLLPLGLAASTFSAWIMASGRHFNTLLEAVPAVAILVALLLPPGLLPEPLIWGSVTGFALHLAGLGIPIWRKGELRRLEFGFNSLAWQGFWGSVGIMALGQTAMSSSVIIDQFIAAHLGPGSISTISYAHRVMALILGMGALAISRAVLPIFSEVTAREGSSALARLAPQWAGVMLMLGVATAATFYVFAPWIVSLLFERGSFSAENTLQVVSLLRWMLIQVPFYFSGLVFFSALSSQGMFAALSYCSLTGLVAKIIFLAIYHERLSVYLIAASVAVMYVFWMAACALVFLRTDHEAR